MEWWMILIFLVGTLLVLFALGMPIAFCFLIMIMAGSFIFMRGTVGISNVAVIIMENVGKFVFIPVFMFVLMGELMFLSGAGNRMISALDEWLGRIPGRLSLLSVLTGTVFANMSGASMASTSLLGSVLIPEMEKRGYKKTMSIGPILGSSGLAMMVPPSALAVFLAAIAQVSVGRLLMAIIIPGLLMAVLYTLYIVLRCHIQPQLAPVYDVKAKPIRKKLVDTAIYVLPLGFVILAVIGFVFMGIASPSESAALGALVTMIIAACYKKLNWGLIKKSMLATIRVTVMVLWIFIGAIAFGQILAFTGTTTLLVNWAVSLPLPPKMLVFCMMFVCLCMGSCLPSDAILMITLPIFLPIIYALGFDPIWFCTMMLLNMEIGQVTPPFGEVLFVMKSVAPSDTTMAQIYKSVIPFILSDIGVIGLMMFIPELTLWLPSKMG